MHFSEKTILFEILLGVSVVLYFVDIFFFIGAFYITIPLTIILAIIATLIAVKHKEFILIPINLVVACIPIAAFLLMPW